jgi:hypothetical protein
MTVSEHLRNHIRELAENRCGYCLVSAIHVYAPMEIDHLQPTAEGGTDNEENLWLACPRCNNYKSDQTTAIDPDTTERVALFNPRLQKWREHFKWNEDNPAQILGLTPCGKATIIALKLNNDDNLRFRQLLVSVKWYLPDE